MPAPDERVENPFKRGSKESVIIDSKEYRTKCRMTCIHGTPQTQCNLEIHFGNTTGATNRPAVGFILESTHDKMSEPLTIGLHIVSHLTQSGLFKSEVPFSYSYSSSIVDKNVQLEWIESNLENITDMLWFEGKGYIHINYPFDLSYDYPFHYPEQMIPFECKGYFLYWDVLVK